MYHKKVQIYKKTLYFEKIQQNVSINVFFNEVKVLTIHKDNTEVGVRTST